MLNGLQRILGLLAIAIAIGGFATVSEWFAYALLAGFMVLAILISVIVLFGGSGGRHQSGGGYGDH